MSFDVVVQGFRDGDADRGAGNGRARAVLAPYVVHRDGGFSRLVVDGHETDVFGLDGENGFLANHVGGRMVWDLLVQAAQAGGLVILPVGCPTCVVAPEQVGHLPPELREGEVVLVRDGADLLRAIEGA